MAISLVNWTVVFNLVLLCSLVYSRPQETSSPLLSTESYTSVTEPKNNENGPTLSTTLPRDVKNRSPPIGESIKMVASQLLEHPNSTAETPIVADTRIPPKLKNQLSPKNKIKTRLEDIDAKPENSHAGVAVPVTMDEIEKEIVINKTTHELSTSKEGISTWILLSNPTPKEQMASTEPTKVDEVTKKSKPSHNKNKKRPQNNDTKIPTRHHIIGSIKKSDLVAGGSALNDNVLNKIKDTVLSNVQKNKNTIIPKTTTEKTTSPEFIEMTSTKKDTYKTSTTSVPTVKVTPKISKKKINKNKNKVTTTTESPINESAMLPMEAKEQEIELEISTPATTTKKPKRTSSKKKKNKTKKRKTSTPKPEISTALELKSSNKTKTVKPSKTPESPITTQIYNYLSREVMPSVGVGVIGLAGLVGLASYFLYPFATPVRRTFEVDKKDDLYRHNGEEYASEGNGQAEEEMLGTVLAGMPVHSKNRLNPYMGQTSHTNVYSPKKEQDLRYRHVASNYDAQNYNHHYPQQKTGIAHGAAYSDHKKYSAQQTKPDNRFAFTTESYPYEKSGYTPYASVEPIYAAPSETSGVSGYGSDAVNGVVYGIKPSVGSDFSPVYPFEGQVFSDSTNDPVTYPPTSMFLGSNNESDDNAEFKNHIDDKSDRSNANDFNKFVVGNVPKELADPVTPAIVPEHGPRKLNKKKRSVSRHKRDVVETIEQVLRQPKTNGNDVFLSNEIDNIIDTQLLEKEYPETKFDNNIGNSITITNNLPTYHTFDTMAQIVESVSTLPVETVKNKINPIKNIENLSDIDSTTTESENTSPNKINYLSDVTTGPAFTLPEQVSNEAVTETTTDFPVKTTKNSVVSPSSTSNIKSENDPATTTAKPTNPNIITYPPITEDGNIFTFLKRLLEFKYRLGLSILQTTSESLNRYLRNIENAANNTPFGSGGSI